MVIYSLWLRQIKRFIRARSRIIGAVGQPLLFLLALGYGLGAALNKASGGNYLQYLVPGVIAQTILFSAMFFGAMIMFDRQFGFLKEMLVVPVPRAMIMFGNALGGATTTLIQGAIVLVVAVALGFRPEHWYGVPLALLVAALLALTIACFSSGIGSFVQDMQGFQAINQFIVFPLYFLSGALYPLTGIPHWLAVIAYVNPMSYAVDALRYCLIGQTHFGFAIDLAVLVVTFAAALVFGSLRFNRIQA